MKVTYYKSINENKENRVEYCLQNFDYEDGNDYLAKIFQKEFGMEIEEKVDYIYFSIIKVRLDNKEYEMLWHEDTGNCIYAINQDEDSDRKLEEMLNTVLEILNRELEHKQL